MEGEKGVREKEANFYYSKPFLEEVIVEKMDFESVKNHALIKNNPKITDESIKRWLDEKNKKEKISEASKIFTEKEQAKYFTDIQPLFFDKGGIWWLWNNNSFKWEIVDEVDILNMIEETTGNDVITPNKRTLILNSLKQQGRKEMPKKINPKWIQFKSKIYDLDNGNIIEASPKFFVTNPIPYELDLEKDQTPTMDRIFKEWVGEEYSQTLYEILAYCMLPDYPLHRLFCFIGDGLNGKSCFMRLLSKFIGSDNITSTELDTLLNSRFEVTRLHKKLVCVMGETNFNEMSKTSIIKKLTGQDMIGFEYKNKTPFEDTNYAKILISTNSLPTTSDKTDGFYRRWMIIDFPNKFSEKKDILAEIPEEEYNALCLKCLKILKELLGKRGFTNEGSIQERMERYESKSNFLNKFIKEFTIESFGQDAYITKNDFYKKFNSWCKENRHREMSEVAVGKEMKKLGIESERKSFDWLNDGRGGRILVWGGIKWKD